MKENDMMSYEMYEDFKETMVKTIKTELSAKNSQSIDTDLPQRNRTNRPLRTRAASDDNSPAYRTIGKHRTKQHKGPSWYG